MTKVRLGYCVYFDADRQDAGLLPLLECLSHAIGPRRPIDRFVRHYIGENGGVAGGDPGWSVDWISDANNALFPEAWKRCMNSVPEGDGGCFEAWTDQNISCLDPPYGYYPKSIVLRYTIEALEALSSLHVELKVEIDSLIEKFRMVAEST